MTGSDINDPRYTLKPGMYDAGEAAMGMKHFCCVKKPDAFRLGRDNPDDPKVRKTVQQLGVGGEIEDPKPTTARDRSARLLELGPRVPGRPSLPGKFLRHKYL